MAFTRHLWGTGGGFADLFHSEAVGTRVLQSHPLARLFKIAISRAVKEPDVDEKKRALETLAKRRIASPTYTELLKEVGRHLPLSIPKNPRGTYQKGNQHVQGDGYGAGQVSNDE